MRSPRFLHLPFLGVAAVCHQLFFGVSKTSTYANILALMKPLDLPECQTGPEALTDLLGKSIPRTCISYPVGEDGLVEERCFFTYVPDSAVQLQNAQEETRGVPLVVDVHGYMGCPYFQTFMSGWFELAEKEGFVVMWPGSTRKDPNGNRCWLVPGGNRDESVDRGTPPCCCYDSGLVGAIMTELPKEDPRFIKDAIDSVVEQHSVSSDSPVVIDKSRIYMAGHSNGCIMSFAMAAMYSDTIAAVCCHAGTGVTRPAPDYTPVPIWMLNGEIDQIVPVDGSFTLNIPLVGKTGMWPVDQLFDYWAGLNECSEEKTARDLLDEDTQQVIGSVTQQTGCSQGATVENVLLSNAGHYPFKLPPEGYRRDELLNIFGPDEWTTTDTTAMAWEFCSSHSKESNLNLDKAEDESPGESPNTEADESPGEAEDESPDESPNTEVDESSSEVDESSSEVDESSSESSSCGQGRMVLLLLLSVPLVMQLM